MPLPSETAAYVVARRGLSSSGLFIRTLGRSRYSRQTMRALLMCTALLVLVSVPACGSDDQDAPGGSVLVLDAVAGTFDGVKLVQVHRAHSQRAALRPNGMSRCRSVEEQERWHQRPMGVIP